MMQKTVTSVNSPLEMRGQRWVALAQDQCALNALSVFAQVFIGFALYLYDHVSTPGYLSFLLTVPYALLLWGLGRFLAGRMVSGSDVLASAAGKRAAKAFYALFALLHLLDAQMVFFALCALLWDVMPDHSPVLMALAVACTSALALGGKQEYALSRLSRFLKWVIGLLLLYCAAISVPYGSTAHFFPLLGQGIDSIGTGALWLCGAVSAASWPLIMPQHEKALSVLRERKGVSLRPQALVLGAGLLTYLISDWLMPFYTLARPEDVGWRLLLAVHMTPSIPAWSTAVIGLLLLFLLALSHSVDQASGLLIRCAGKKKPSAFLRLALLLLLTPAGMLATDEIQSILIIAAPWRGLLALVLLSLLSLFSLIRGGRPTPKEAA